MKKVWIFGDSYADLNFNTAKIDSWPLLLEKNYNVNNYALAGSGPEFSLQRLYTELQGLSNEESKEISVVFLISNVTRYNFSFLKPFQQSIVRYVTFDKSDERLDAGARARINSLFDKKKISFIRDFFKYYHFHQHDDMNLLKILGALRALSNRFEKVLCASCFSEIPEYIPIHDGNFYLFSHTELYKLGRHNYGFEEDPRSNHIDNWQHPVFAEQIENWLLHDTLIDFEKIKGAAP